MVKEILNPLPTLYTGIKRGGVTLSISNSTYLAFYCTELAVGIGRRKYLVDYKALHWNSLLF